MKYTFWPVPGRQPLDVLLGRRRYTPAQIIFSLLGLLWLSGMSMGLLALHPQTFPGLFVLELLAGVGLAGFSSWHGGLLENARRSRFLELVLTTCMSVEEWSDGMLGYAGRSLCRVGLPFYLLIVAATTICYPAGLPQAVLWLPAFALLMVAVSYCQQLRATLDQDPLEMYYRWRGFGQMIVAVPAYLGIGVVMAWAALDPPLATVALAGLAAGLWLTRYVLHRRLRNFLKSASEPRTVDAPRLEAWSSNPIVVRESCRAARQAGGLVRLFLQRWCLVLLALLTIAWAAFQGGARNQEVAGNLLVLLTMALTFMSGMMVYWAMFSAMSNECKHDSSIVLQTSGLPAADFADGWTSWVSRFPSLAVAVFCGLDCLGLATGRLAVRPGVWSLACLLGLFGVAVVSIRSGAYLGLLVATLCRKWRGGALYGAAWLSSYVWMLWFAIPYIVVFSAVPHVPHHIGIGFFGWVAGGLLASAVLLLIARSAALRAIGGTWKSQAGIQLAS